VQLIQAESAADLSHFLDEQIHHPESGVVRVIRPAASKLVIKDHRTAGVCEPFQRLKIIMSHAGPAVQTQQGESALPLPDEAIPGPVSME
jgi:predicted TIM-barrel fold metal-dependent hydrolase